MTLVDPFADDTTITQEETAVAETNPFDEPPAEAPKKPAVKKVAAKPDTNEGKVSITLKGGAGFDAPWVVIHAVSLEDAYEQVSGDNAGLLAKIMDRTASAASYFSGLRTPAAPAQKPAAQQAPAGAPECPPGWEFKSGVSKAGKPYKGFFPPRGDDTKPIFFN